MENGQGLLTIEGQVVEKEEWFWIEDKVNLIKECEWDCRTGERTIIKSMEARQTSVDDRLAGSTTV
jgi:hypothetical protein